MINYQLPTNVALSDNSLNDAISVDKKGEGSKINLILLSQLGKAEIVKMNKADFA